MKNIILNTNREGYDASQVACTMTVGELIDALRMYDPNAKIYFGNDRQSLYGWYTYGSISEDDIYEEEIEEEEDEDF